LGQQPEEEEGERKNAAALKMYGMGREWEDKGIGNEGVDTGEGISKKNRQL
jgi:hypothetical protein